MMAVDLHNRELLLPSQFFTDEQEGVFSVGSKPISQNGSLFSGSPDSGSEYLSSPVESEVGSTKSSEEEEAQEEDDYIDELTRKMAYYMFQDEDKHEKSWGFSGSPQSTLCSPLCSKLESPNGQSRETILPVTPLIENFEKMKINEEFPKYSPGEGLFSASIPIPLATTNADIGFQSKKSLIDEQIRAIQFYKLKQEQAMKLLDQKRKIKHNYQSIGRVSSGFNNVQRVPSHPCAGCTLHPQQSGGLDGSNMRAVFLGTSCSKSGSGGTGVFLPRRTGTSSETRKKQGCPTVLIPAKVVHALKLHFEKMGVPSRLNTGVPLEQDAHVGGRNSISPQQKRHPRTAPAISHQDLDLGLPQEWTY